MSYKARTDAAPLEHDGSAQAMQCNEYDKLKAARKRAPELLEVYQHSLYYEVYQDSLYYLLLKYRPGKEKLARGRCGKEGISSTSNYPPTTTIMSDSSPTTTTMGDNKQSTHQPLLLLVTTVHP